MCFVNNINVHYGRKWSEAQPIEASPAHHTVLQGTSGTGH